MSSKIDIQKRCKWCNAVFTAHKTTTQSIVHTDAPILPTKTGLGNSALKVCNTN